MRLYEVTEQPRYMALASYFIGQRGTQPHFYDEEYEKRGQTSYWHTYGPAWMVKDKAYSRASANFAAADGHWSRGTFCLSDDWRGASRSPEQR